jgi:hypothetical protein
MTFPGFQEKRQPCKKLDKKLQVTCSEQLACMFSVLMHASQTRTSKLQEKIDWFLHEMLLKHPTGSSRLPMKKLTSKMKMKEMHITL